MDATTAIPQAARTLPPENYAQLDAYIASLNVPGGIGYRRGVLIQVLHQAQVICGFLPEEVQKHIAARLDLHVSEVYGVVSFYHYFRTKRTGKYCIDICMGTACFVRGAPKVIEKLEGILGVKVGETTADGRFTLSTLRCVGACSLAPVVQVNGKTYGRVTVEDVPAILAEYKN